MIFIIRLYKYLLPVLADYKWVWVLDEDISLEYFDVSCYLKTLNHGDVNYIFFTFPLLQLAEGTNNNHHIYFLHKKKYIKISDISILSPDNSPAHSFAANPS